jgi:alkylated DNA repair protein (DNA oxidative demethylase)
MSTLFDAITRLDPSRETMAEGAVLLRGDAVPFAADVLAALPLITAGSPFRHMVTPGGFVMSVAMTNCGAAGWVTDRSGYRYDAIDPASGQPCLPAFWTSRPLRQSRLAIRTSRPTPVSSTATNPARATSGQERARFRQSHSVRLAGPVCSLSVRGLKRNDPVRKYALRHGDVAVWGGPSRLRFHGLPELKDREHETVGRIRLNLTFRGAL